jgi:hypothetical protein
MVGFSEEHVLKFYKSLILNESLPPSAPNTCLDYMCRSGGVGLRINNRTISWRLICLVSRPGSLTSPNPPSSSPIELIGGWVGHQYRSASSGVNSIYRIIHRSFQRPLQKFWITIRTNTWLQGNWDSKLLSGIRKELLTTVYMFYRPDNHFVVLFVLTDTVKFRKDIRFILWLICSKHC